MAFEHTHRLRVRFAECDRQGHVFNGHWLTFFDVALTELWREAIGDWDLVNERGIDLVVREANAVFHAPARFDDELDITARVDRIGTTSITTTFDARRDGTQLVEGRLVHVVVDAEAFGKLPVPDWVREALG